MKIAIIGVGNLGMSIAKGIHSQQLASQLYLTKRSLSDLNEFNSEETIHLTTDNIEAVQQSDVIILAVQPIHIEQILNDIKPHLTKNHIIISTITGLTIDKIEDVIGNNFPIIRAMPNTAISVGKSMTCLCANDFGKSKIEMATSIFDSLGHTMVIQEKLMQSATVVCASGIAFWMRLIRATTQAAIQLGFDAKEAQELAMFTSQGAAELLIEKGNHPEEEIDKVTTPMGCTIEGLNEMEHSGMSSSLIHGMVASFNKIHAIKKEQV